MITYRELVMLDNPVGRLRDLDSRGQLEIVFPELHALKMSVPKGYRHKDNWEHSLLVLENAISMEGESIDPVLRVAALLHDVGKPLTRKFDGKGVVTFQHHEFVGAKIAREILKRDGEDKVFIDSVSNLIRLHMRAYGFSDTVWTDSAVRRLITDVGGDDNIQLDRLLKIFKSDLTTSSGKKRGKILKGIDSLSVAFDRVKSIDARASLRPAFDGVEVMKMTGFEPGRELGRVMKFLNSDAIVTLNESDTFDALRVEFPEYFN